MITANLLANFSYRRPQNPGPPGLQCQKLTQAVLLQFVTTNILDKNNHK
jgi:hypothetical protein